MARWRCHSSGETRLPFDERHFCSTVKVSRQPIAKVWLIISAKLALGVHQISTFDGQSRIQTGHRKGVGKCFLLILATVA